MTEICRIQGAVKTCQNPISIATNGSKCSKRYIRQKTFDDARKLCHHTISELAERDNVPRKRRFHLRVRLRKDNDAKRAREYPICSYESRSLQYARNVCGYITEVCNRSINDHETDPVLLTIRTRDIGDDLFRRSTAVSVHPPVKHQHICALGRRIDDRADVLRLLWPYNSAHQTQASKVIDDGLSIKIAMLSNRQLIVAGNCKSGTRRGARNFAR